MSSSIKEQVEVDILRFFEQIETQDKYIHLSTSDHLMDYYDLNSIISSAKNKFANEKITRHLKSGIMNRKVSPDEVANLLVIEATIGHLNKIECLKKLPRFDYKDDL